MKHFILIGIVLGSLGGLGCGGSQRYDWQERYRRDYRQPYDLYALHELFLADPAGRPVISVEDSLQVFLPDTTSTATYFFAGNEVYLAEEEWTALFSWVNQGNTAFISSRRVPEYLDRALRMYAGCYTLDENLGDYLLNDSVALSVEGAYDPTEETTCTLVHQERFEPVTTYWGFVDPPYYCDLETVENLGYLDYEWINFFRFAHGDGYIYVHLAPQAFTNFQLRDPDIFAYANECLSVLGPGTIYWDEYHKSPYDTYQGPQEGQQNALLRSNHALRYVLSEPALATGWYLLVALAVLFVLFRAKRRQAVVPVRPPRENTSFAYLQDIGQLYYQSSNHRQLAEEQRKLFETHLRNRYGLSYRNDATFTADLATRAGITAEQAERIQRELQHVQGANADFGHGDLLRFYRALEAVYLED